MAENNPTTKTCAICLATKDVGEFHLCRGRPAHICKLCHRQKGRENYAKKRSYYIAHNIAYRKANWQAHQIRAAKHFQSIKREEIRRRRASRQLRLEAIRAYYRKRRKEHAAQYRSYWHDRRARELSAEGRWTSKDIDAIHAQQGGKCHYCRISLALGYHIDHIKSLIDGGSNWPDNLQLLCPQCNTRKNRRDPFVFANEMGLLF